MRDCPGECADRTVFVCTERGVSGPVPQPHPKAAVRRPQPLLSPPTLGAPGGWGAGALGWDHPGLSGWAPPVSQPWFPHLARGHGQMVCVLVWPGTGGQVHRPSLRAQVRTTDPSPPRPPPTAMVELDGDDVRISSRGKLAERDIVQVKPSPCLLRKCRLRPRPPGASAGLLGGARPPQKGGVSPSSHTSP